MKFLKTLLPVCLLAGGAQAIDLTNVPTANEKVAGMVIPTILSPELYQTPVAVGTQKLENPKGIFTHYGFQSTPDGATMFPTAGSSRVEMNKTEPDKNTYLVLHNQRGADANYNYGSHFLYQGHELGSAGYITRINLDADSAHAITLMATTESNGTALPVFDGSTWYPFSQRLLFTSEGALGGGVWQASLDVPSKVESLTGIIGQGGFEGIQADPQGRLIIVEDAGGTTGTTNPQTKRPNSFVFRFLPKDPTDLRKGGKMQVLQAMSLSTGQPIFFDANQTADAAAFAPDVKDMHTYGKTFQTTWVTIHDTDLDGTAPYSANALAKDARFKGTPFKRPENGQFRPGTNFGQFYFAETGDTDIRTQAGADYGGWGSVFRLDLTSDTAGVLSLLYKGDKDHAGFDNCSFLDENSIVFVEDGGDTLHTQRNGLDNAWLFDVNEGYDFGAQPIRIMAEGRDPLAALDSLFSAGAPFTGAFANEGDNEITGWHTSDGDATVSGLLGAKIPTPFKNGWRTFYTQQHGENFTWEIRADSNDNNLTTHGSRR